MAADQAPSDATLETIPSRALDFLRGVGTNVAVRAVLAQRGYTAEEHALGWKLLHATAGYEPVPDPTAVLSDTAVRDAIAELDAWDEPHFRVIEGALARKFPAQRDFVFHNLAPATGAAAVLSVATMLDRLDALESGDERAATRKQDKAALELLAERGITPGERARLRKLVKTAQAVATVGATPSTPSDNPGAKERRSALLELHAWHRDWSGTARSFITRRDHLILLGLAQRKKRGAKRSNGGGGTGAGSATPSGTPNQK